LNRFFLTLDIHLHPEKGQEGTGLHGHAKTKGNLPCMLSVAPCVEAVWSRLCGQTLAIALGLLLWEFLLENEREILQLNTELELKLFSFSSFPRSPLKCIT